MTDDLLARELHNKATRGGALTEKERAHLQAWYDRMDAEETALLAANAPAAATPPDPDSLRAEIAETLGRLTAVTQSIQVLTEENEALRREIAVLQQTLAARAQW